MCRCCRGPGSAPRTSDRHGPSCLPSACNGTHSALPPLLASSAAPPNCHRRPLRTSHSLPSGLTSLSPRCRRSPHCHHASGSPGPNTPCSIPFPSCSRPVDGIDRRGRWCTSGDRRHCLGYRLPSDPSRQVGLAVPAHLKCRAGGAGGSDRCVASTQNGAARGGEPLVPGAGAGGLVA